ncbi:MAG: hypothetical protein AAB499_02640 [Patescibacteria group bacterium]
MSESLTPPEVIEAGEISEKPIVETDPAKYISNFEAVINFPKLVAERMKLAQPVDDEIIDQEEARRDLTEILREGQDYKQELWNFHKTHPLVFDREKLPEEVKTKIYRYRDIIEEVGRAQRRSFGFLDQEEAKEYDLERGRRHFAAAKALTEAGLAHNTTVGRILIQFMNIEDGLDRVDPDRDLRRLDSLRP